MPSLDMGHNECLDTCPTRRLASEDVETFFAKYIVSDYEVISSQTPTRGWRGKCTSATIYTSTSKCTRQQDPHRNSKVPRHVHRSSCRTRALLSDRLGKPLISAVPEAGFALPFCIDGGGRTPHHLRRPALRGRRRVNANATQNTIERLRCQHVAGAGFQVRGEVKRSTLCQTNVCVAVPTPKPTDRWRPKSVGRRAVSLAGTRRARHSEWVLIGGRSQLAVREDSTPDSRGHQECSTC